MLDVVLFHTINGGEVTLVGGEPIRGDGVASAVYLSLFGGNEDDSGLPGDAGKQWWGNLSESNPARCYRSETQYALAILPTTTSNLRRIEAAAQRDLTWFVSSGLARTVTAAASMPARNRVALDVKVAFDPDRIVLVPQILTDWGGTAA